MTAEIWHALHLRPLHEHVGLSDWYHALPEYKRRLLGARYEERIYSTDKSSTWHLWVDASNLLTSSSSPSHMALELPFALEICKLALQRADATDADKYWVLCTQLQIEERLKQFDHARLTARSSLQFAKVALNETFSDIEERHLNPIPFNFLLRDCAVRMDENALNDIAAFITSLHPQQDIVDDIRVARHRLTLARALHVFLTNNPGYLQRNLRNQFGGDTDDVRELICAAVDRNIIRRIRNGHSYELYPNGDAIT